MTTMTQRDTVVVTKHNPLTTALRVLVCWLGSAALVAIAHATLDALSPGGSAVAVILSILGAAALYMRVFAPDADVTHALGVGIAWLVMTIVAEMITATLEGHGWYSLLGSPARPLLRNVFLFVWIFAPAIFARSRSH